MGTARIRRAGIRPTAGRLLNAVFSMLGPGGAAERSVLDVYAGTGSFGLRALANGAQRVDFIERHGDMVQQIRSTLEVRGGDDACRVLRGDAIKLIPKLSKGYDVVYVDPPYSINNFEALQECIASAPKLLNEGGTLFLEHHKSRETAIAMGATRRTKLRVYGDSAVSVYRHEEGEDGS